MTPDKATLLALAEPTIADRLARMVAIQMEAAPQHWTTEERREWAERVLLGERR